MANRGVCVRLWSFPGRRRPLDLRPALKLIPAGTERQAHRQGTDHTKHAQGTARAIPNARVRSSWFQTHRFTPQN